MFFGYTDAELEAKTSTFTAKEIAQQPVTWQKTIDQVTENWEEIQAFVKSVTDQPDYDVILTGAGTSEYVGNSLYPSLLLKQNGHIHSIGTTDIVSTPRAYISETKPTLLVSFARSGNSPESVGAVQAAEAISSNVKHLFITCNKDGKLAKLAEEQDNCYALVLTPETHDQSFVMTSSFSSMYVAALMILSDDVKLPMGEIIGAASRFVESGYKALADDLAKIDFSRIIYLGSDVLKGIAQESALKMVEITGGDVVSIYDSPLGFRHGPKSVVCPEALTVIYLSDNPSTRRYELDLLAEVYRDRKGSQIIVVSAKADEKAEELCDLFINLDVESVFTNGQLAPAFIVVAQTLALLYALKRGNTPDNPCPTGEVNRVVQGVTLYEVV